MRTLITLCVLLLAAATVQAQTIDLLERPAATANPSPFDLMHQHDAPASGDRVSSPLTSSAEFDAAADFDLLFVAAPKPKEPEPDVVDSAACSCGCNQPDCRCDHAQRAAASKRKPVIRMKSASWCDACAKVAKDFANAKDLPVELVIDKDDSATETLPAFSWEAGGKWVGPIDPGYPGLENLIALWKSTQPAANSSPPPPSATAGKFTPNTLEARVAASAERHFVARVQGPPVSIGKPGDSEKKRAEPSRSGSTTNESGSEKKSPVPSGLNTATPSASTPSPGGRS